MVMLSIGCGENKNALLAAELLNKEENFHIEVAKSDEDLISDFNNENFDAIIRGSLKSSNVLKNIRNSNKLYRVSYIKAKIDKNHYEFLLGPVGIDEGDTLDEKLNLAVYGSKFIEKINKTPKIAILAGGRKEDLGRSSVIDKSIEESECLAQKIEKFLLDSDIGSDFSVKNYYILIEKAVKEGNNIIIAPDGIIGNIIFRSLVLLSSWESYGAIALGIDKIFIDTSRDQTKEGYIRALRFAQSLVENKI